ncbi:MAG: hypothetical protein RL701_6416 [Pseudomonadota bacterium]|jgi:uncharacterized protein YqhQ
MSNAQSFKKNGPKIAIALMVAYFVFVLNLGTRTFAQHVIRIATTPESKELAYEVFATASEATHAITRRIRGAITGYP